MQLILLPLFLSSLAIAEYRVFLLNISQVRSPSSETKVEKTKPARVFKSTLDPEQYVLYHALKPGEVVTYTDTWMCPGNTSQHKPLCNKP